MSALLIDFESRSTVDLRKRGVYIYSQDPSTEILCLALMPDGDRSKRVIWFPKLFSAGIFSVRVFGGYAEVPVVNTATAQHLISQATTITAHNAQFERLLFQEILHKRHGWPAIPLTKFRCTAARAAALALPRSLDQVCSVLNLPVQKDKEGRKLMMRLCRPQPDGTYIEDIPSLVRLAQYCLTDVDAEHEVEKALPPLPASEERIWQLDQRINDKGIGFDREGALQLKFAIEGAETRLLAEVKELTKGAIKSARQVAALITWLKDEHDVELDDLKKGTVKEALSRLPEGKAKRMLEIRQEMSLSSTAKINTALGLISPDSRIRGTLLYHGASTGRWGGKGFQPHNLPRDSYKTPEEVEDAIAGFHTESTIKAASKCLRGLIVPQNGKFLHASDYNAIEARVLAWLADEREALEVFRRGLDPYRVTASNIFGVSYEKVTKDQRQIGKVAILALGYQGWVGAFQTMAPNYGVHVSDEQAEEIIIPWRAANPAIRALWAGMEDAAFQAVRTGKPYRCGKTLFGTRGDFLFMKIPSGRMLAYPYPIIEPRTREFPAKEPGGKPQKITKDVVTFMGEDTYTHKWTRLATYGGKLVENLVQATARDLLCDAMLRMDALGYAIVLSVHDEIVWEDDQDRVKEVEDLMTVAPAWAAGCPLGAAGWRSKRYRKD